MTRKTRRLLFFLFLILFLVLTPFILLYALGYSFDWENKSIVITGGLYLKSQPKKADILLDGKFKDKTPAFVKRLIPGEYSIIVSRPQYHKWEKLLEVSSRLVTEVKHILLVPQNPPIEIVKENYIKNIFLQSLSDNGKEIIYISDSTIIEIDPTKSRIADPRQVPKVDKPNIRILNLETNKETFLISLKDLTRKTGLYDWQLTPTIHWHPYDSDKFYFSSNSAFLRQKFQCEDTKNKVSSSYKTWENLYIFEINQLSPLKSTLSCLASDILNFTVRNNNIYYIRPCGECAETLVVSGVEPEEKLYKMNLDGSSKQEIIDITPSIQNITLSKDGKKLLWQTNYEIWVMWLEDTYEQPMRHKSETELIVRSLKKINQATWYPKTDEHIIFTTEDNIKITELDGRGGRNTFDLLSVKNSKILYNNWNKILYFLNNENLYQTEIK